MKSINKIYIFLQTLPLLLAGGCADEPLLSGEQAAGDPNAVKFSTQVCRATATTRSASTPIYEPLVLTDENGGDPLYLHTYESDKIGFDPGRDSQVATRGMQVETAESLIEYHKNFAVHAMLRENSAEYIPWTSTSPLSNKNIWVTNKVEYWPADNVLSFHAVSPATELSAMKNVSVLQDNSFFFDYSAKKGAANNDAQMQTDLLIAASACNKEGSRNGNAPLKFHHALSAVKFAIRDVMGGEIVNIQIAGVYGAGKCVYTVGDDGLNGTFSWSNYSEANSSYSQNFNYKFADPYPYDDSKEIQLGEEMPEKTFMLIPQQIPDNAEIIITLKRTGMNPETKTVRAKIKDNNVTEWKPGHEYIYTISTSKDNWVYVLKASGNHNSETGAHAIDGSVLGDQIYVYSPSKNEHDDYGDKAYFYVTSYRYRANRQNIIEDLPWTASHGPGIQYRTYNGVDTEVKEIPHLTAEAWIPTHDAFSGSGSSSTPGEKRDLTMAAHYTRTDWPGDWWLQEQTHYSGNSKDNPWDLSTCGGKRSENTANTYVVDREGWYCFPLVYGNAIKDGNDNPQAYTYNGTHFTAHSGTINSPYITGWDNAKMLWSDVYNAVSDVELLADKKMIRFKVNQFNLQQGNVVIAICKGNTVLWSWQIWITEHWLDPKSGMPHAFDKTGASFSDATPTHSGRRWRGDVKLESTHVSGDFGYYMAAYNVGWCDPKNVDYLKRKEDMTFVQTCDGKPTGKTVVLPIIQDGDHIEYKVGNNTYYQWGRKDPFLGFHDHENSKKKDFGDRRCRKVSSQVTLANAIQNPEVFYYGSNNWVKSSNPPYLWNTYGTSKYETKVIKTVYDPCPPGYVTPPSYVFRFVGKCDTFDYQEKNNTTGKIETVHVTPNYECDKSLNPKLENFNGNFDITVDAYTFRACGANKAQKTFMNTIWLTSTGTRWYADNVTLTLGSGRKVVFNGADNFNSNIVYLWSCIPVGENNTNGLGLALGYDKNYDPANTDPNGSPVVDIYNPAYVIDSYFIGRKTMARPVRGIREL